MRAGMPTTRAVDQIIIHCITLPGGKPFQYTPVGMLVVRSINKKKPEIKACRMRRRHCGLKQMFDVPASEAGLGMLGLVGYEACATLGVRMQMPCSR